MFAGAGVLVALAATALALYLPDTGSAATQASSSPPPSSSHSPAATAGSLGPHAAVPAQYRQIIITAADFCSAPAVSPALIAAILKEESGFNPNFSSPQTASFGIAGWTPSVFHAWASSPQEDYMKPADAVPAVARFLCWLDQRLTQSAVPGDITALLAAGYDTSDMAVIHAHGVPPVAATFAAAVVRDTNDFEH